MQHTLETFKRLKLGRYNRKQFQGSAPYRVRLGPTKLFFLPRADHINKVFRAPLNVSTKATLIWTMKNIFGTPADVIPFYMADDSGITPIPCLTAKPNQKTD